MNLFYSQTKQARKIPLKSSLLFAGLCLIELIKHKNYFQVCNKTTVQLLSSSMNIPFDDIEQYF